MRYLKNTFFAKLKDREILRRIEVGAQVVSALAIVVAIIGYIQINSHQKERAAFDVVAQFYEAHLTEANYQLWKIWRTPEAIHALSGGPGFSMLQDIAEDYVLRRCIGRDGANRCLDQNGNPFDPALREKSLFLLLEYFDLVHRCIKSQVCDQRTVVASLGEHASDIYCLYGLAISNLGREASEKEFGTGLMFIANLHGECDRDDGVE